MMTRSQHFLPLFSRLSLFLLFYLFFFLFLFFFRSLRQRSYFCRDFFLPLLLFVQIVEMFICKSKRQHNIQNYKQIKGAAWLSHTGQVKAKVFVSLMMNHIRKYSLYHLEYHSKRQIWVQRSDEEINLTYNLSINLSHFILWF